MTWDEHNTENGPDFGLFKESSAGSPGRSNPTHLTGGRSNEPRPTKRLSSGRPTEPLGLRKAKTSTDSSPQLSRKAGKPEAPKLVALKAYIRPDLKVSLKVQAAKEQKKISTVVEQALMAYLR